MTFTIGAGISRYRSGGSGPKTYRDPWVQPFAASSYINLGIGSNAVYGPNNDAVYSALQGAIAVNNLYINDNQNAFNAPFWVSTSVNDPLLSATAGNFSGNVYYPSGQPAYTGTIHVPSNSYAAAGGDGCFQVMDENKPTEFWETDNPSSINFSGGTLGGGLVAYYDTRGNGVPYSGQGAANLVPWRAIDYNTASISRVLPVAMPNNFMYGYEVTEETNWGLGYNCVWPATASDYWLYTHGNNYNTSAGIPFGSILFIPKGVFTVTSSSLQGLLGHTPSAVELAAALQLQNYGLMVSNTAGGLVIEGSWDFTPSMGSVINNVYAHVSQYLRVMCSWMYAPAFANQRGYQSNGLIPRGQSPTAAPGAGYQYDPRNNPSAPLNGGGTYPPAPSDFDPALGIGNGRSYAGMRNGYGAP